MDLAIPPWALSIESLTLSIAQPWLFRSHGRAKTDMANETNIAAMGNGPKVSGQISRMISVPMMIPTPDQKKAALIVVIAYQYKSSLPNCSRLRMLRLAMRVLSIFYAVSTFGQYKFAQSVSSAILMAVAAFAFIFYPKIKKLCLGRSRHPKHSYKAPIKNRS